MTRLVAVRPAVVADTGFLLAWRNDPGVRRWSRSSQPIDPVEHVHWLRQALADPDRHVLVICRAQDDVPVATTRYDLLRDEGGNSRARWEISITVAPQMRGRGVGGATLRASDAWLLAAEPHVTEILAYVRPDNEGSRHLFERSGYRAASSAEPELDCFVRRWEGR